MKNKYHSFHFVSSFVSAICRAADGNKFFGDQRSAANQSTIHIRHVEQFRRVRRLDATPVQDRHRSCNAVTSAGQRTTQKGMDSLSLNWSCRLAGANGPDRFIGKHRGAWAVFSKPVRYNTELLSHDFFGDSLFTLRERFTDTNDRNHVCSQHRLGFQRHGGVVFTEYLAALGMPDDDIATALLTQHAGGNFAGESSFGMLADVLRAPSHFRPRQ